MNTVLELSSPATISCSPVGGATAQRTKQELQRYYETLRARQRRYITPVQIHNLHTENSDNPSLWEILEICGSFRAFAATRDNPRSFVKDYGYDDLARILHVIAEHLGHSPSRHEWIQASQYWHILPHLKTARGICGKSTLEAVYAFCKLPPPGQPLVTK